MNGGTGLNPPPTLMMHSHRRAKEVSEGGGRAKEGGTGERGRRHNLVLIWSRPVLCFALRIFPTHVRVVTRRPGFEGSRSALAISAETCRHMVMPSFVVSGSFSGLLVSVTVSSQPQARNLGVCVVQGQAPTNIRPVPVPSAPLPATPSTLACSCLPALLPVLPTLATTTTNARRTSTSVRCPPPERAGPSPRTSPSRTTRNTTSWARR